MSTMSSPVSCESPAAEPVPTNTPVAAIDDLSGRTLVPGQDKKRKADDSLSSEDAMPSTPSTRAAKRARVEDGHAGGVATTAPVQESIFGGPVGPPRALLSSSPSNSSSSANGDDVVFVSSRLKRARVDSASDEEVVFVRAQLAKARVTSSSPLAAAAADAIDASARGQKRGANDDEDDVVEVGAHAVKRLRANDTTYFVEAADEEVSLADLPTSATDVVLAANSNDITIADDDNLAAVAVSTKAPTGFFDLPLEIREMIYHQVLIARKAVMPRVPQRNQAYRIGFPIGKLSNLLLAVAPVDRHKGVSKNEIMPFVMRHNEFKLTIKHHKGWLNSIPRKHAACIRRLIVECDGKNKHDAVNLVAFQNTIRKRLGADEIRELTYQFLWSMNAQTAMRTFDATEFRMAWKKFNRLEKITVDVSGPRARTAVIMADDEAQVSVRVMTERNERVLSRLALDTGVKVVAQALRPWRRDKKSLGWAVLELKEGWKNHVDKNKKEGKWVPKTRDEWPHIVDIRARPTAAMAADGDA